MTGPFAAPAEDPGALAGAAERWGTVSGDLSADRRAATSAVTSATADWTGPRSAAFDRGAGGVQVQIRVAEDGCADVATVLGEYSHVVVKARHEIADLHRRWVRAQTGIDTIDPHAPDAGTTSGLLRRHQHDLAEEAEEVRRDLAHRAAGFAARIDAVTSRVAPASSTLGPAEVRRQVSAALGTASFPRDPSIADALAALLGAERAVPAAAVRADGSVDWSALDRLPTTPPAGTDPAEVHRWWTGLSPAQQDALLRERPDLLGNLDGIPVLARDVANRLVLPRELARLRRELGGLGAAPPRLVASASGWPTANPAYGRWRGVRDDLLQRIAGSEAIRARLDDDSVPPYLLIGFRPRAGHGRAVVAQGDPDLAADVSTFVTGTTTRLGGIGTDLRRSQAMMRAAVRAGAVPSSLAVITWYGYDAPQNILPQAASMAYAEHGAPLLARFLAGLRVTHTGPRSHTTVVAHSYGSTLVGYAAGHGHGLAADDLVLVASPGADVGNGWIHTGSVDDLQLDGPSVGHVYATRSRDDAIKHAVDTHLGADPTSSSFGATTFGSDPHGDHSAYWDDPHNPALVAMGEVIAGHGSGVEPPTADQDVHPTIDTSIVGGPT